MRIALVVAIGAALLSVVLNVFQAHALMNAFADLHFARVFPLGFVPPEKAPGQDAAEGDAMAIYGDSRALLWNSESLQGRVRIISLGHGAQTSSQLLLQLVSTPAVRSQYALLQVGINDIHPLGALEMQKAQALANLRLNLQMIVTRLLERSQFVVISTIIPPGPVPLDRRLMWDPKTLEYIEAINHELRNMANGDRILLLDGAVLLGDESGKLRKEYVDSDFFLHLNRAAYDVLNAALLKIIERLHKPSRDD
jgi:hypothetical protein